jgi:hypothetical protein
MENGLILEARGKRPKTVGLRAADVGVPGNGSLERVGDGGCPDRVCRGGCTGRRESQVGAVRNNLTHLLLDAGVGIRLVGEFAPTAKKSGHHAEPDDDARDYE